MPEDAPGMLSTLRLKCWYLLLEEVIESSSCSPAHVKKRFDLACADSIRYTRETGSISLKRNFSGMNERKIEGEEQRPSVCLLTQWTLREQLYNKCTCDIIILS